ncbi:MAG: hypothetical protein ACK4NC_01150 [Candidatus Gracilibacteria bacterium]
MPSKLNTINNTADVELDEKLLDIPLKEDEEIPDDTFDEDNFDDEEINEEVSDDEDEDLDMSDNFEEKVKKQKTSVENAKNALKVDEANKESLKIRLENSTGAKRIAKSIYYNAVNTFSKKHVNKLLKDQNDKLEASAKKTLGVLPEAAKALDTPEAKEIHENLKEKLEAKDTTTPEYFALIRYILEKKIDESLYKDFNDKTSVRELFGRIAMGHLKSTSKEEPTDIDLLDQNLLFSTYSSQYMILNSMTQVEHHQNHRINKKGTLIASRKLQLKNLAKNGGYIAAGIAAKVLVSTVAPIAIVPGALLAITATASLVRGWGKQEAANRTPTYFNRQIVLSLSKAYAERATTNSTPENRAEDAKKAAKLKDLLKNPISPEEIKTLIESKLSVKDLHIIYSAISEWQQIMINDTSKHINPVYLGYVGELKNTVFKRIYEKSKKTSPEKKTILSFAKTAKERTELLSANIDHISKDSELVDQNLIDKVDFKQVEDKDRRWHVTKSLATSSLLFGTGYMAGHLGMWAVKEYTGDHVKAIVQPLKTDVGSVAHQPVTSTLSQTTDTHTDSGVFKAAVEDKVSSVNNTPIAPKLDPALGGAPDLTDVVTGKLPQNMNAVNAILKEYENRTLTAADIAEGKAKLQDLYNTMTPAEKTELAAELAKEQAKESLGVLVKEGPTGPWSTVTGLRKFALHTADGKWGGPNNWFNGFGTHPLLGIDFENSMAFDDWYLYNNATNKGYGMIVKTIAGTTDVAKDTLYLGLTEPLEKFVRLQGHIWDIIGFPNSLTDFEVDIYTRKILSGIMASGGGDAFDGAAASEVSGMISALKNDRENLVALLTFLGISVAIGTYLYKKNQKSSSEFWKSTKGFFGSIKKHATSKPAKIAAFVAAPALYLWMRYPGKWTYDGVTGLFRKKPTTTPDPTTDPAT